MKVVDKASYVDCRLTRANGDITALLSGLIVPLLVDAVKHCLNSLKELNDHLIKGLEISPQSRDSGLWHATENLARSIGCTRKGSMSPNVESRICSSAGRLLLDCLSYLQATVTSKARLAALAQFRGQFSPRLALAANKTYFTVYFRPSPCYSNTLYA
jgi:hypothetical protein